MTTSPTGKKLVSTKGGLRMIYVDEQEQSSFDLDAPIWQPDSEHLICKKCGKRFSYTVRKHHCRRCGHVFCNKCCASKISLPRIGFVDPQRVCIDCEGVSKKDLELYEKHIPALLKGGEFHINQKNDRMIRCQLNPKSQKELIFVDSKDRITQSHEPIALSDVTFFQCVTDSMHQTRSGAGQLVGVNLKYVTDSSAKELNLNVSTGMDSRKEAMLYLDSLQKAMTTIFETNR